MKALVMTVVILAVIAAAIICFYLFVLQYPELKKAPKTGKWYRITDNGMICSDGSRYRAFFRKEQRQ